VDGCALSQRQTYAQLRESLGLGPPGTGKPRVRTKKKKDSLVNSGCVLGMVLSCYRCIQLYTSVTCTYIEYWAIRGISDSPCGNQSPSVAAGGRRT
jgi:hypothetical protein